MAERATVSPHLARLAAAPRPAGGPAAAAARAYCADVLRTAGFVVSEHSFEYSRFPGAWGSPVAGAISGLAATALFAGRHSRWAGAATLVVALIAYLGLLVIARVGVLALPVMRRRGVNLEAVRGEGAPTVWLVAHIDSKWQPVSMIARVVGTTMTAIAGFLLVAISFGLFARDGDTLAPWLLGLSWLGALPLLRSTVHDRGFGAVDNASGVAAVLEAAAILPTDSRVGVLITDAEELALAGARAWVKGRAPAIALNCDSIDDGGALTVLRLKPEAPAPLLAVRRAAAAHEQPLSLIATPPGILTDSVAFRDAGWQTLTLSRGDIRTLQRIHTSRDTLNHMRGTGIVMAARILATAATELG